MKQNKPAKIITHHAVSKPGHDHLDVGQWHYDRWNGYRPSRIRKDIARYAGYHYIILEDGTTEQCRAHDEEGIHCRGQNFNSIGVCFMGNFNRSYPTEAQKRAFIELYNSIGGNLPVYPHRKYATKDCHGSLLSDDYFANLVDKEMKIALIERLRMLIALLQTMLDGERMK